MMELGIGVIGLGCRGRQNLETILGFDGIRVTAICDVYEDFCDMGAEKVKEVQGKTPFKTTDYTEVLGRGDVDVVTVFTSWETHIKIAADAMKAGKIVGLEVGGAASLEECRKLVNTQRETGVPLMLLENCCYGRTEILVRNIVRDGIFGDIVHCHGAYGHDLRQEVTCGKENRHYRLKHYLSRNCENYPTHELGPIAKILDINRGNSMARLVSVASKAMGAERYINDRADSFVNRDLIGRKFKQGDIINTLITCTSGETISLTLDTTLPRPYSREFTIRGTKGMYEENTNSIFLDGDKEGESFKYYKEIFGNAEKFEDKYLPDCWKNITEHQIKIGHGGMDFFVFEAFFSAIRDNKPMPIDVYDAAAWMSITALSEYSIANGSIPVDIPDFTDGEWKIRPRLDV